MAEHYFSSSWLFLFQAVEAGLLAIIFFVANRGLNREYVKYWSYSFALLAIHFFALSGKSFFYTWPDNGWIKLSLMMIELLTHYLFLASFSIGVYLTKKNQVITTANLQWVFTLVVIISLITSLSFAFDVAAVYNRFYLRESLSSFIFSGVFFAIAMYLLNARRKFYSAKLLIILSFLICIRFLFYSFISVIALTETWFLPIAKILTYFDFAALGILGFTLLLWIQGSERNVAENAITRAQYLGKHDLLTGALNRDQVIEKLPAAIENAIDKHMKLAIFLLDMKRFKFINDTYGLKVGDAILGKIARRLTDSILLPLVVGRISGDSFVFAIEINENKQLEKAAQHLHDLISRPYKVGQHDVQLQCSIGYCIAPQDGKKAESLLQIANLALFHAESNNLPSVQYQQGMQSSGGHLPEVEKEIRRGLAQQEFVLHFQPQLNLLTNRIEGVEALVRWYHPERGILSPDKFLHDFDVLGLNAVLDSYVLKLACKTHIQWFKQFKKRVAIAVNISAAEFQDPSLIAKIQALLFEYDVPPKFLELEITENVVITEMEMAMDTIVVLQNMGIKVSIDDFGTGYSSLAYLRKLPIDKIKIDRSFITDFASNDSDLTIVKSMIKLSHGLGKRVLAEGVETEQQLDLLRKLGCDAVQGYFINPPLPEDKLTQYFIKK